MQLIKAVRVDSERVTQDIVQPVLVFDHKLSFEVGCSLIVDVVEWFDIEFISVKAGVSLLDLVPHHECHVAVPEGEVFVQN